MLTLSQELDRPRACGPSARDAVHREGLLDLAADAEHGIERRHRLLKHEPDFATAYVVHLALRERQQVASLEDDPSACHAPGGLDDPQ